MVLARVNTNASSSRLSAPRMSLTEGIPEPWAAYMDDESGQTYYHNPLTGESVWELPALAPARAPHPPVASSSSSSSGGSSKSSSSGGSGSGGGGGGGGGGDGVDGSSGSSSRRSAPVDELKARLLTLVSTLPDRGRECTLSDLPAAAAILQVVDELEPLDPASRDGWMSSDALSAGGRPNVGRPGWVLRYTSSRTFHLNTGLTGYAYQRPDCSTPQLLLSFDEPRRGACILEEPIVRPGAEGAVPGDSMVAECTYSAGAKDVLRLEAREMRADGRRWSPRDPNLGDEVDLDAEKAIRVIAATLPVFLDETLLVLRSAVLESVLFVWTPLNTPDPPPVELPEQLGGLTDVGSSSLSVLERALAARDAAKKSGKGVGRPSSHTSVGKIGNE